MNKRTARIVPCMVLEGGDEPPSFSFLPDVPEFEIAVAQEYAINSETSDVSPEKLAALAELESQIEQLKSQLLSEEEVRDLQRHLVLISGLAESLQCLKESLKKQNKVDSHPYPRVTTAISFVIEGWEGIDPYFKAAFSVEAALAALEHLGQFGGKETARRAAIEAEMIQNQIFPIPRDRIYLDQAAEEYLQWLLIPNKR